MIRSRFELLFKLLNVVPRQNKKRLLLFGVSLGLSSVLDLVAVGLVGIVSIIAMSGVGLNNAGNTGKVNSVLKIVGLENFNVEKQIIYLGVFIVVLFISRTIFSLITTRNLYNFLGEISADISSRIIRKTFSLQAEDLNSRSGQDRLVATTSGVDSLTIGILGSVLGLVSDVSLLFLLMVVLIAVNPLIAIVAFIFFGCIAIALHQYLGGKARELSISRFKENQALSNQFVNSLDVFSEISILGKFKYVSDQLGFLRRKQSAISANSSFLPHVSKYVIEASLIIGAVLLATVAFSLADAKHAISLLAIFMAAGTRLAPAILRIQQNLMTYENCVGPGTDALELLLSNPYFQMKNMDYVVTSRQVENPNIVISNLTFKYLTSEKTVLDRISTEIPFGSFVAFVGPSGSGKSTLLSIVAGLLEPSSGHILIAKQHPQDLVHSYPRILGYVPQNGKLIEGTIRQNIALFEPETEVNDERVWRVLDLVQLKNFVLDLPDGLEAKVGFGESKLSGGQIQRICLARALYFEPKILLLDEPTSALDAVTESEISRALLRLRGGLTIIAVAHRLSTVMNADKVCYIADGKLILEGSFEKLRESLPEFAEQTNLLGL